jgi:hypothetical protein
MSGIQGPLGGLYVQGRPAFKLAEAHAAYIHDPLASSSTSTTTSYPAPDIFLEGRKSGVLRVCVIACMLGALVTDSLRIRRWRAR